MDLAPALCGVAGRHPNWARSRRGQGRRNLAAKGFTPPPDSRRRRRRNLAAAAAGFSPVKELSAGFSPPPPPESCRGPFPAAAGFPPPGPPRLFAGVVCSCTTWCRAHPADLSLEGILFLGSDVFRLCVERSTP